MRCCYAENYYTRPNQARLDYGQSQVIIRHYTNLTRRLQTNAANKGAVSFHISGNISMFGRENFSTTHNFCLNYIGTGDFVLGFL